MAKGYQTSLRVTKECSLSSVATSSSLFAYSESAMNFVNSCLNSNNCILKLLSSLAFVMIFGNLFVPLYSLE